MPTQEISIHALLAESDHYDNYNLHCVEISIHALLAESDVTSSTVIVILFKFLSTLSLRRATNDAINGCNPDFISIHALLAESDHITKRSASSFPSFLSTLSLRRATLCWIPKTVTPMQFLSTLSLRRATANAVDQILPGHISIHALLAESDT